MEERKRALVLGRVVAGRLTIPEAALLLGLSERSVWRLKSRLVAGELDPAALAHGNAGRVAAHRLDPQLTSRVVAFARDGYAGVNLNAASSSSSRTRRRPRAASSGSSGRSRTAWSPSYVWQG